MIRFDHVAICATDLEEGASWVAETLGVTLSDVGHHPFMGTHNRLLSLGGQEYLEVIAIDPAAQGPDRPRWFDLDNFSGPPALTNWLVNTPDVAALKARLPDSGELLDLERGPYRWTLLLPEDGKQPFDGVQPAALQWHSDHPAPNLPPSEIRLTELRVSHPEADLLQGRLGLEDPRVVFVAGDPGLQAHFATPQGPRSLG